MTRPPARRPAAARPAPLRSVPLRSVPLRSVPLRSASLRLAPVCLAVCALALAASRAVAQPAPPPPAAPGSDAWLPRGAAELAALDKVRAQATTLQARVGQPVRYGSLTITVRGCVVRPPDQAPDSAAFVEVADSHPGGPGFRGWMIAGAPALGMMEHPLYDLRVVACR